MGAQLPWDPFVPGDLRVGRAGDKKEYFKRGRRLLTKPKAKRTLPMFDNNPISVNKWFNKDIYKVCKAMKEAAKAKPPIPRTPGRQALKACLESSNEKEGATCTNKVETMKAAAELPGILFLQQLPKCMTVTERGPCTRWNGNKETEYQNIRSGNKLVHTFKKPAQDIPVKKWKSCALVGRSPIIKLAPNGAPIDAHEAVWRFNMDTPSGAEKWVGNKTQIRILNNGAAHKAMDINFREKRASSWHPGEHQRWMNDVVNPKKSQMQDWVMWSVRANEYLDRLSGTYKPWNIRMIAPEFITWLLKVYFSIMADLEQLGLGPFACEINSLPSGTHALFMSAMACEKVNVFGVSYTGKAVFARSAHVQYKWAPYEHHNWEWDGFLLRVLHLANRLTICTRDDPDMSTDDMLKSTR
mmetsp:Transcript_32800/g.45552  ORF Transcript_32800/g.45552 Transcript_32800/m.45552 type:complete len:412 (-) Transcript_32800:48-1283(-)